MKNRIGLSLKAILIMLCLCIALSCFAACKPGKNNNSTSSDSSSDSSSSEVETPSEPDDTGDDGDDDDIDDTEPDIDDIIDDGEEPGDEEEYVTQLRVRNSQAPLTNTFMGCGSVIYQLFTYIPDQFGRNFTEKQAQAQFDRMKNIGINYVRSYYNSWMAYDTDTKTFNYDNANMRGFYKECKELEKRGINIAITTGWSLHALTDNSSSIPSLELYVEDNFEQTIKNWTKWMVDSLKQIRAHGVNNVKDLILFTEPGKVHYTDEKMYQEFNDWLYAVRSLHNALKAEGMRQDYRFIGPNQANNIVRDATRDGTFLRFALENADEYIDIYTSHNYPTGTPADDVYYDQVMELWGDVYMKTMKEFKSKKPFWIDEWNVAVSGQLTLNQNIPWRGTQQAVVVSTAMNLGISNTILWALFDQQWPNNRGTGGEFLDGVHITGLAPSLQISTIPTTQYYAYTLMSKYITTKGNGKVYYTEFPIYEGVYGAFCENEAGEKTLLIVNVSWEDVKFEVNFDKAIGRNMYRHLYNPSTIMPDTRGAVLPADRAYKNVKSKLVDQIPTGSVAVYTTIKG